VNRPARRTGDARLRELAEISGVEVHGVLWITDEMATHGVATPRRLYDALCLWWAVLDSNQRPSD
jgi:hypothetical protein